MEAQGRPNLQVTKTFKIYTLERTKRMICTLTCENVAPSEGNPCKNPKKKIYALVNTDGSFQNQKAKYNYFF